MNWYVKRIVKNFTFFVIMCCLAVGLHHTKGTAKIQKQYGILIADEKGTYQFYDLNLPKGNQCIEITEDKKVMIPLRKVCSYLPDLSYEFNFSTNKATVKNQKTGKRIEFTVGKKTAILYSKDNKQTKVKLSVACYTSKDSNALMVPKDALSSICAKKTGYHYYGSKEIKKAQYDSSLYEGILVYNMKKQVNKLPNATKVTYVNQLCADATVKVTIPEGYSVAQIIQCLVEQGVCISSKALYQAMNQVDYSQYTMFSGREVSENVCFPLEGYLYPDTYEFYKNSDPLAVLKKILKHSNQKLTAYVEQAEEFGYSLDEVLCIASIIEKEASRYEDQVNISAVLKNRLNQGMRLQCDASIYYIEKYIKSNITGDKDRYNTLYNTYKCKALPAGAICNPGSNAIKAALNPADCEYLYFASDEEGTYYFSNTLEEHQTIWELIRPKEEEDKEK